MRISGMIKEDFLEIGGNINYLHFHGKLPFRNFFTSIICRSFVFPVTFRQKWTRFSQGLICGLIDLNICIPSDEKRETLVNSIMYLS